MIDLEGSLAEQLTAQHSEGCVKTKSDLDRYRHVLDHYHPNLIIETGTFSGKSARWFSQWAPVLTIDVDMRQVDPLVRDAARSPHAPYHPIEFVGGFSTDDAVLGLVADRVGDPHECKRVFVSLDSDHSMSNVWEELRAYSGFVSMGSYMVVEDTIVRWCKHELKPIGPYWGSPLSAVELFLAWQSHLIEMYGSEAGPVFEIDHEVEDMYPTTQFPSGWLRRVG